MRCVNCGEDHMSTDRPVEGSTPIASPPAQCGHGIAVEDAWVRCQNTPDHDGLHISGRHRWHTGGHLEPPAAPAGEADVFICPTCDTVITGYNDDPPRCPTCAAPAGEVVSVPPPVALTREELIEALMVVVEEVAYWRRQETIAPIGVRSYTNSREAAMESARSCAARLYAAGVAEGRRQRDAEIRTDVLNSARQVAREAGFGPGPDSVTVTYDRASPPPPAEATEGQERTALVLTTVEQTLRTVAMWLESDHDSALLIQAAEAVKGQGADGMCCPVCDEVGCDAGCPLETLRGVPRG